ncbi:MAG: TetR/AcrR family transcriptional regulator [Promethearchaeota archaeon]
MEKPKKFTRNKQEKINSIYKTFYELLNQKGYDKITTNLIAENSDVSIGTIYRYFPDGKSSIVKGTLEHTGDIIFDIGDFNSMNERNLPEMLEHVIRKHLRVHRENYQYHLAVNQAILSNKDLFRDYSDNISQLFENIATKIRERNDFFQNVPINFLINTLLVVFNTLEAFMHRHLFITPIFPTDEELILFLKKIVLMIITSN